MSSGDIFRRLAVALTIGLLIGLERGWRAREEGEGERVAGLRTHALSGLLGGVSGLVATITSPVTLGFAFAAFTAAIGSFAWLAARANQDFSVTGVVAGMLAFMLGAYAVLGDLQIAVGAGVAATILLALKQPLHGWLQRISWIEIRAALILLAMTFLFLPLLPDRFVDPWDAINPATIWKLAILICAISFAGYLAIRIVGDRTGIILAAVAGGLASSTATTLALSRLARAAPQASPLIAGGVLLAGTVMLARVAVIVGVLNAHLLPLLAWPLGAAALPMLLAATVLLRRSAQGRTEHLALELRNPFEFWTALQLAGLVALVMLAVRAIITNFGNRGLPFLAALSGLADVDAITLSLAHTSTMDVSPGIAAIGIAVAAGTNTCMKAGITFLAGGRVLGVYVSSISALAIAAAALACWFSVH